MRFTTCATPPDWPARGDDRANCTGCDAKRLHCNSFINPHCLIALPTNKINCRGWQLCLTLMDANPDRYAGSFWPGYFCMAISCNDVNKIHSTEVRRWWTAICFSIVGEEVSRRESGCKAKTLRPVFLRQNSSHLSRVRPFSRSAGKTIFSFLPSDFFSFGLFLQKLLFTARLRIASKRTKCHRLRSASTCVFFYFAVSLVRQK